MDSSNLIIISVFNYGAIRLAKNHLQSLVQNGISNYMAYVTDDESVSELKACGYNVSRISIDDITSEKKDFGTKGFNTMSYLRYKVINDLLRMGMYVWYLDVDTVCRKDIRPVFESLKDVDIDVAFQSDMNMLCTGCMLYRPTRESIHLTELIYQGRNQEDNDQMYLRQLMFRKSVQFRNVQFSPELFPCGVIYFDAPFVSPPDMYNAVREQVKQVGENVIFVHANWMVGNATKESALKSKGCWYIDE
jgi:hypothetical protein